MARTTSTPATEERPVSGSAEAAERDKRRGAYKRGRVVAGRTVQRADDRKKTDKMRERISSGPTERACPDAPVIVVRDSRVTLSVCSFCVSAPSRGRRMSMCPYGVCGYHDRRCQAEDTMVFRAVTPSGGSERRVGSPRSVNRWSDDGERRGLLIHIVCCAATASAYDTV